MSGATHDRFKKAASSEAMSEFGLWWPVSDAAGKRSAIIVCKCHSVQSITGWGISDKGVVSPSVHHDTPHCGYHGMITLEGW